MPPLSTLPPEMTTLGAHAHQIPIFFEGCSFLFFRNYITQKRTCVKIRGYFHFPGNSLYLPGEASPGPLLTLFSLCPFSLYFFIFLFPVTLWLHHVMRGRLPPFPLKSNGLFCKRATANGPVRVRGGPVTGPVEGPGIAAGIHVAAGKDHGSPFRFIVIIRVICRTRSSHF